MPCALINRTVGRGVDKTVDKKANQSKKVTFYQIA
jgi:hypothetical protein